MKFLVISLMSLLAGTALASEQKYFAGADYVYQEICPPSQNLKLKRSFHGGNFYVGTVLTESTEVEFGLHLTPWHSGTDIKHRATAPFAHVHYLHPINDKFKLVGGLGVSLINFDYRTPSSKHTTKHGAGKIMIGGRYKICEDVSFKAGASVHFLESVKHYNYRPRNIQSLHLGIMYHF